MITIWHAEYADYRSLSKTLEDKKTHKNVNIITQNL